MADETTTDTLAEIEGQAEPQPVQIREGRWRTRNGEIRHVTRTPDDLSDEGRYPWHDAEHCQTWHDNGRHFHEKESPFDLLDYLGTIEPEHQPERIITPDDVAAEALAGVHDSAVVANPFQEIRELRQKLETTEAALLEQQQRNEKLVTHGCNQHMQIYELQRELSESQRLVVEHQRQIQELLTNDNATEPQPQPEPQPVHLQAMVDSQAETIARLHSEIHGVNMEIGGLQAQLEAVKAESAKRLQQVEELRSEVSHVQRLLGDEKRRFTELETLMSDLRAVNTAQEKAMNSAAREKADLQHRLDTVAAEWAVQAETIRGLEQQLEAVKDELVRQCENSRLLQVELDAREQVPEAVSDRFEEGLYHGKARAVETIVEWLEPLRKLIDAADNFAETNLASNLASDTIQALPHIMRSLTGLTDEED